MKFRIFKKKQNNSKCWKSNIRFSVRHPLLIGHYTTDDDGEHRKKLRSIQEVADFICDKGMENGNLLITTADNTPFISTFGIYISRIDDKAYRDKLLDILIPMQTRTDNEALNTAVGQYLN